MENVRPNTRVGGWGLGTIQRSGRIPAKATLWYKIFVWRQPHDQSWASRKHKTQQRAPWPQKATQKAEEMTEAVDFLSFLCKWKYPKHPQHVQLGEVRWTAAWNWALIHPFCSLLMNTDNGKSVDAENPRFLRIYRLIFCTSSSHFYACAKWQHSWCKVLQNYHRDIFTLHFHWCGKWLQVSKAKENVSLRREKEYSAKLKKKWICYPHCCLQFR